MKIIRRLWKDPVWSKVIAGLIMLVIGSLVTAFVPAAKKFMLGVFDFVADYPFEILSGILTVTLALVLFRNRKKKPQLQHKQTPLEWLKKLSDDQLANFRFLFWFPLHHTLKTGNYYSSSETLDHVPEISDLLEHGVLTMVVVDVIHYAIEIDKQCYGFMDGILATFTQAQKEKQLFAVLRSNEFVSLFSKRSPF